MKFAKIPPTFKDPANPLILVIIFPHLPKEMIKNCSKSRKTSSKKVG
jgi:hypothetical protein